MEGELEALFTDLYEVAQSEPEYLHAPNEMRAEYEERKRELESGNLSISKEGLADFLEFIQRSEKKADRLSSIRNRIEAIMKENPEVETHEISRKAALATGIDGPSDKGEADPFR
ncbi:MAG: hypothetical protein P1U58_18015 [Verrucomicrobiales bacterium]|nr:hypothetical protein [Verrucomicrobiales bacterium]